MALLYHKGVRGSCREQAPDIRYALCASYLLCALAFEGWWFSFYGGVPLPPARVLLCLEILTLYRVGGATTAEGASLFG